MSTLCVAHLLDTSALCCQENEKELAERTVLYINLDGAVRGNWSLDVQASHLLHAVSADVMRAFKSVRNRSQSVYDEWQQSFAKSETPT